MDAMTEDGSRTSDGRYLVINGRRWRATDPGIPEKLRAELVAELMAARRAVNSDPGHARARVQDAKLALGERGEPWWEPASCEGGRVRLAATMRALLRHRRPEATICPSDAARVVGGTDWRGCVPQAQAVAAKLHDQQVLLVCQRGKPVDPAIVKGPIRLARGPAFPD